MTCQTLREAIVDIARGTAVGQGTSAAVECHLDRCEACAALMARERELSVGLRALAASFGGDGASETLGRRLREVFAERQGIGGTVGAVAAASAPKQGRVKRHVFAAAAAVVFIGLVAWWPVVREPATGTSMARTEPDRIPQAASRAPTGDPAPVASVQPALPNRVAKAVKRPRPVPQARYAVATGFVELPGAVGLPDFESGQIIRMEIPLTSLPAYGLEIVPDARDRQVEADLLVGQDGQARAIRLVVGNGKFEAGSPK